MKYNWKMCFAIILALILLVGVNKQVLAMDYVALDLNPSGFSFSRAYGVSGGQQLGDGYGAATGEYNHAILWRGTAALFRAR